MEIHDRSSIMMIQTVHYDLHIIIVMRSKITWFRSYVMPCTAPGHACIRIRSENVKLKDDIKPRAINCLGKGPIVVDNGYGLLASM